MGVQNLIKLYVSALVSVALVADVASRRLVSYFCQFAFLFSGKVFRFTFLKRKL